jgi:hypothetical protein
MEDSTSTCFMEELWQESPVAKSLHDISIRPIDSFSEKNTQMSSTLQSR